MRELTRKTKAKLWIARLNPQMQVISAKVSSLGLGTPRLEVGPALMAASKFDDCAGDRIRRGAVWFVGGMNCGFHVDFCKDKLHIEAWTGGSRRSSTWITGSITDISLKRDLTVCLVAAGLTDLARTEEVRNQLFSRTARN